MPQPQQLPGPNADMWDWQMHGTCRGVDSAVFFHPDGERGRARAQARHRHGAVAVAQAHDGAQGVPRAPQFRHGAGDQGGRAGLVQAPADAVMAEGELRGLRVLLVEDNPVNRTIAERMLAILGAAAYGQWKHQCLSKFWGKFTKSVEHLEKTEDKPADPPPAK